MHDLVRDVAIQIASSKEFGFVIKVGIGLKKWPGSFGSFEDCTTISLMGNRLKELLEGLVCPLLKVLLLELNDSVDVPCKFFKEMKALEVLSLKGGCLSLESLKCSTNLQSLQFIECECVDLISLRKLQRLKILGFLSCYSSEELPEEIGELESVRLMDLTGCTGLRRIHVNLIGRLKKLEELLIGSKSFMKWGVGGTSRGGMNASLTELNSLSHLSVLSLRIPETKYIPRDFVFPKLLKYEILIGGDTCLRCQTSTILAFDSISITSLNAKTFEQLFPSVDQVSHEEKVLLLLSLTDLKLVSLSTLKYTWKGPTRHESLQSLTYLKLWHLCQLKFIFTPSLAQSLPQLETLEIKDCSELEHIITSKDDNYEGEIIPNSICFLKLKTLFVCICEKLEYVFPLSVAPSLLNLEELHIVSADKLKKYLVVEKEKIHPQLMEMASSCFLN
ncbi:unnamed protein product [Dovyalis caffra]|uniref:Disease resistance protein At4g27190-like leucine-rich repeats domain-containing protein n=1 Tax=Dovyalis caffra TaxID=77055 RepID=A0AAV1RQ77_9ROSI|nr:unnamed protein product [Dovyalis caffra]